MSKTTVGNPQHLANILNIHFIKIGPNFLVDNHSRPNHSMNTSNTECIRYSSFVQLIETWPYYFAICPPTKWLDLMAFYANCLKKQPQLFNNTINTRIFPEQRKLAKVSALQLLTASKLSINVSKTEYMLIASKHAITNLIQPSSIKLGNDQVKKSLPVKPWECTETKICRGVPTLIMLLEKYYQQLADRFDLLLTKKLSLPSTNLLLPN